MLERLPNRCPGMKSSLVHRGDLNTTDTNLTPQDLMRSAQHLQEADSRTGALRSDASPGVLDSIPLPVCRDLHLTQPTFGANEEKGMSGPSLSGPQPIQGLVGKVLAPLQSPACSHHPDSEFSDHPTRFSFLLHLL